MKKPDEKKRRQASRRSGAETSDRPSRAPAEKKGTRAAVPRADRAVSTTPEVTTQSARAGSGSVARGGPGSAKVTGPQEKKTAGPRRKNQTSSRKSTPKQAPRTRKQKTALPRTGAEGFVSDLSGPPPELPVEYGETDLLVIPVDPDVVFADWEIRQADIPPDGGELRLRAFTVDGAQGTDNPPFFDEAVHSRVGRRFVEIQTHGREVTIEIGVYTRGRRFLSLAASKMVSMPPHVDLRGPVIPGATEDERRSGY
jgi:hypothetical protein